MTVGDVERVAGAGGERLAHRLLGAGEIAVELAQVRGAGVRGEVRA